MIEHAFQENYTIFPHEIDFTKHIKIVNLYARLLTSAGTDSQLKGSGIDTMHQAGCTWVLSRIAIEIEKQPYQYDDITIQTWVEGSNKLINTRNFLLTFPNNDIAVRACSYWSMIDMNNRKVINLEGNEFVAKFPVNPTTAGIEPPARIPDVKEGEISQHTIGYNDIDYNGHVNSVRYLQWVLDTYPLEQFNQFQLHRIDINYQHEITYGATVTLIKQRNDNQHLITIKNPEGITLCKVKLVWTEKN
ncbi:MAG: hypothetical protein IKC81_04375 [Paludibacteraceae bacterium]|nr:hypothetical protein [Paludibacteraceae bacterium]